MIKSLKSIIFLVIVYFGVDTIIFAQDKLVISGQITDSSTEEALIGASVLVKGDRTVGTVTDFDGNYSLNLPNGSYTLVYSYIGYSSQEKDVSGSGQQTIDVKLNTDIDQLDEIIIVGYGEAKRGDIAGAVSSVSSEDFNKGVIISPEQLLQGKVSGLQISATSGEPGAGMNVNIRGLNSLRSGGTPLYVVDGIPLGSGNTSSRSEIPGLGNSPAKNPLNFLNPSDIESIQVLKDASATAIYGSRAANGVIIIKTKSGNSGDQSTLEYAHFTSLSVISNKLDLLTGDEFRAAQTELGNTSNILDQNASVDWQDEIFRPAFTSSHNLTFSSGSENATFSASLGVLDQDGIIEGNNYKRYSGRVNASSFYLDKKLKVDFNLLATHTDNAGVPITSNSGVDGDLLINALRANPTTPNPITFNEDGSIYLPLTYTPLSGINPLLFLDLYHDNTKIDRVLGSFSSSLKPLKGLEIRTQVSVDRSNSRRSVLLDRIGLADVLDGQTRGYLAYANNENTTFLIDNYITYNSSLGKFDYKVMVGYSYQDFLSANTSNEVNNLYDITSEGIDFDLAYELEYYEGSPSNPLGTKNENWLKGSFSRVNLGWDDRYLLEATIRRDVSNKFTSGNRTGIFPSAAFKWKISNEPFLKSLNKFADLGLRLSWGQTGDQNIPNNSNFSVIRTRNSNGNLTEVYGNPSLSWETQTQSALGLDFELFDKKIYGNVDYFSKETKDLLFRRSSIFWGLPGGTTSSPWGNSETKISTSGMEFLIGGYPITSKDITWDISFNLTATEMRVRNLDNTTYTGTPGGQGVSGAQLNIIENDKEFQFFLYDYQGFDENGDIILGNEGEKIATGTPFPDFTYGINSTLYFKNFDLSMNWTGVQGREIFNSTSAIYLSSYWLGLGGNITKREADNQPVNVGNASTLPLSTYYLEDGDFLRLNNLQIGYSFNLEKIQWLRTARIYFTGQNLLLFTKYSGYDPEVNTNLASGGFPSYGIDSSSYPKARTFTFGVNLSI